MGRVSFGGPDGGDGGGGGGKRASMEFGTGVNRQMSKVTQDGIELPNEVGTPEVSALWHLLTAEGLMPKYRTESERKQAQEIAVSECPLQKRDVTIRSAT